MLKTSAVENRALRYLLQAINYTVFMALIWYFATSPSIRVLADDEAVITIAFAHAGDFREPCRKLSQEELAKLPPNMRKPEDCPRERSPVTIEMQLDGQQLYNESLQPPGLFKDGGVDVFYSVKVPVGTHQFAIRMNDSVRIEGFNHTHEREINVDPAQILLVRFNSEKGFIIQ
jgi:hypothetical protein